VALSILFATHGYKPAYNIGGPIHSVGELAEGLVRRGHEVRVFTTNSNLTEDLDVQTDVPIDVNGVEVWYFRRVEPLQRVLPFVSYVSQSIGFLFCPEMRQALDRLVPTVDIVHTHIPFVYPTLAAGRAAHRHGKPLFYHQRGVFDPQRLRFRSLKKFLYIRLLEKPLMDGAAGLFALTEAERVSYVSIGAVRPCHVVSNGVDVSKFRDVPTSDPLAHVGVSANATVVLFMGRLHPVKGADVLIKAFLAIQAKHPQAVLVMAGPDEWGAREEMQDMINEAGAASRVLFLGPVAGEDKLNLLARADLFCLPSDAEGFSMAVLEALASSTAVLLSPGCHFDEVAAAGVGCVVEKTLSSMSDALARMLEDTEGLKTMGRKGRDFVSASYSWSRIVSTTEGIYLEACRKQKNS
jgi:glycosyltransferase involved in cell wall biosynthesis